MRTSEQLTYNPLIGANPLSLQTLCQNVLNASVTFGNNVAQLEREAVTNRDPSIAAFSGGDAQGLRLLMALPGLANKLCNSLEGFFQATGINATPTANILGVKSKYTLQYGIVSREFEIAPLLEAAVNYGLRKKKSQELEQAEKTLMNVLKKFVVDICTWLSEKTLERKIDSVFKEVGGIREENQKEILKRSIDRPGQHGR